MGPYETIDENENFLRIHRHTKYREADIFSSATGFFTYKDVRVINQETVFEEIDEDPSEGQDWNWEDYDWWGLGDQTILFWRVGVSGDALKIFSLSHEAHLEPLSGSDRTHQHILHRLATSFNFIFTSKDLAMIWLFELHSDNDEGVVYT